MHPLSPYHSTSTEILFKRFRLWRRQYLHVIIYTSLFWIFIDVFFIMLFSDCTKEVLVACPSSHINRTVPTESSRPIRNPRIIIDKIPIETKTTTKESNVRKWWEVDSGLKSIQGNQCVTIRMF